MLLDRMYSAEEALKIGREFKKLYSDDRRYDSYIAGIGALGLRRMRHKIFHPLTSGKFIIPVFLKEHLPRELEFPKSYRGIPIVTKIVNDAIALSRSNSLEEKVETVAA